MPILARAGHDQAAGPASVHVRLLPKLLSTSYLIVPVEQYDSTRDLRAMTLDPSTATALRAEGHVVHHHATNWEMARHSNSE